MAGSISSLGLGSGTLSSDVIEKLRKADEGKFVKPYERRIKENETKTSDLNTLRGLAKELKMISDSLSNETSYADVDTKISGDTADIVAVPGARVQDFTLDVQQLAQKDIIQSGVGFASEDVALGINGSLDFTISGTEYKVELTGDETLKDLKDKIFEQTDGKVIASSLKVGTDANKPFSLIMKSVQSGTTNGFSVVDHTQKDGSNGVLNLTNVQTSQDAKFKMDGVEIVRSSNKIDDLIPGVTIQLKDAEKKDASGNITKSGKTLVSIKQNNEAIMDNVNKFVQKYNELIANLNTVTSFDAEKNVRGTFQGNSEMNDIKTQLKNTLINTSVTTSKTVDNKQVIHVTIMSDFGMSMNRDGTIELDSGALQSAVKNNFQSVKDFFQGTTKTEEKIVYDEDGNVVTLKDEDGNDILDENGNPIYKTESVAVSFESGLFSKLKDKLYDFTTTNNGLFKIIEDGLKSSNKSLATQLKYAKTNLDSKYDIMTKQFAAYDAMIAKMNAGFSSLEMMIKQSITSK